MITAKYRTASSTGDWGMVHAVAYAAGDALTIVDEVESNRVTKDVTFVTVTYQALNPTEAAATALSICNALAHIAPTDKGRVTV
jgi:hypothetical protein